MATGGRLFQVPVKWLDYKELSRNEWAPVARGEVVDKKQHRTKRVAHVGGTEFGDASTFVDKDKDLFVIATGVGESILLDGVRYPSDNTASTHTLCICSRTRSTRYLTLNHNLRRRKYAIMTENCKQSNWLDYKQLSAIVTDMFGGGSRD